MRHSVVTLKDKFRLVKFDSDPADTSIFKYGSDWGLNSIGRSNLRQINGKNTRERLQGMAKNMDWQMVKSVDTAGLAFIGAAKYCLGGGVNLVVSVVVNPCHSKRPERPNRRFPAALRPTDKQIASHKIDLPIESRP